MPRLQRLPTSLMLIFFVLMAFDSLAQATSPAPVLSDIAFYNQRTETYETLFTEGDIIRIEAQITPNSPDVGQEGSLFFLLEVLHRNNDPSMAQQKFCLDQNGRLILWDGQLNTLVPRDGPKIISNQESLNVSDLRLVDMAGKYNLSLGYALSNSSIVYFSDPYPLAVDIGGTITIDSISGSDLVPYAPVQVHVSGSALYLKNKWSAIFNDTLTIPIPSAEIEINNGVISTLLPNITGDVSVKLSNGQGLESNAFTVTVAQATPPSETDEENARSILLSKIDEMITEAQSSLTGLPQDEQDTTNQIIVELQAFKEIIVIFWDEMSAEERAEFATFILNSKLFQESGGGASAVVREPLRTPAFTPSTTYSDILNRRNKLRAGLKANAMLDFNKKVAGFDVDLGTSLNFVPMFNAIDNGLRLILMLDRIRETQPVLLNNFTVELHQPPDGIYRATTIPVTFKGEFVSVTANAGALFKTYQEMSYMFSVLPGDRKGKMLTKLLELPDPGSFAFAVVKGLLKGEYERSTENISKYWGLNTNLKKVSDVEIDINDFRPIVQIPQDMALWFPSTKELSTAYDKIGDAKVNWGVADDLYVENDFRSFFQISEFKILNHLPELVNLPYCTVDASGVCTFDFSITDKDDNPEFIHSRVSEDGAFGTTGRNEAFATISGDVSTLEYQYAYSGKPVVEDMGFNVEAGNWTLLDFRVKPEYGTDSVMIEYYDPWEDSEQYHEVPINIEAVTPESPDASGVTYYIGTPPTQGAVDPIIGTISRYTADSNASGEDSFTYYAKRNDIYGEPATVTITIGIPDIIVPSGYDFGEIAVGGSVTKTVTIANAGTATAPLEIYSVVSSSSSIFNTSSSSATLAPGQSHSFPVTFAPNAAGDFPGHLKITSNCAKDKGCSNGKSTSVVQLSGIGLTECNSFSAAGNDDPETHTVSMGSTSGTFSFSYDTYTQKDRIVVSYQGGMLFNTGCVGASGTRTLSYSGSSNYITISAYPNCEGGTGTAWNFSVSCPQ